MGIKPVWVVAASGESKREHRAQLAARKMLCDLQPLVGPNRSCHLKKRCHVYHHLQTL